MLLSGYLSVLLASLAVGGFAQYTNGTVPSTKSTSLTLFFQNNLNYTDDVNHLPFLVLDPTSRSKASAACGSFGESLLGTADLAAHTQDVQRSLGYLAYQAIGSNRYYVDNGILTFDTTSQTYSVNSNASSTALQVLCTDKQGSSAATSSNKVSVTSGTNTFVGFRDNKSFRFLGIPYADPVGRFEYSKPNSKTGATIQATQQGNQCPQSGSGAEDCLFLSIYTPYLPKAGSKDNLKAVFFWIHGGGFTGGSGSQTDGNHIASREDTIFVSINYRLSTLGFLAVPGTDIKGNYGIADQITALEWTRQNIAAFGGDPDKITIVGESAGAGSVRVLLGSPPAIGKFRGGISMSNLGGGQTLGLTNTYSTTYSNYLTIQGSFDQSKQLFSQAGCNQTTVDAQVECIRAVDPLTLVGLGTVARYVVQDGIYVNTPELVVWEKTDNTAHVPVIFGVTADDGSSFISYPKTPVVSESAGLQSILSISEANANSVISSGLFPFPDTGNLTLDTFNVSARLTTDFGFRCIDEATVYAGALSGAFSSSYFYEVERTIGGYDPNNVGKAPVTPGYPLGNPHLPYYRVHGGEVGIAFGTVGANQIREPQDLWFTQLMSGYWTAFIRTLDPNPDLEYLKVRGYEETLEAVGQSGPWKAVQNGNTDGPVLALDWPAQTIPYRDAEQCTWLNYTLTYYLDKHQAASM